MTGIEDLTPEQRSVAETAETKGHRAVREPLIYGLDARASYYRDLAQIRRGNAQAGSRLEKHRAQMKDVAQRETRTLAGVEYRVNPSTKAEQGGEFAPPLWLNTLFATARRPGQMIQRLAPTFDLPPGVSSVSLPRITTGTEADTMTDNAPVDDTDIETAIVKSEVATFAGLSDWSIQSLEQSPAGAHLDWVVFKDLTESIDAEVESECIIGTGSNERFYGLTELPGTNSVTYTDASPLGTRVFPKIGETLAQVGVKRRLPPEALLMNTSRFFWLSTSEDVSNRPLLLEDYVGSDFPIAGLSAVGVYPDDAIPTNLGTSKEQDVIIACRPSDFVLLVSEPKTSVKLDVLSGALTARFEMHRYVAALLGRYPSGVSILSGSGMTVQAGWH